MLSILSAIAVFAAVAFGVYWAFTDPSSPVPREWNPLRELVVSDPVTPVTHFKLRRVVDDPKLCLTVLAQAGRYQEMTPLVASARCGIANRVDLTGVGATRLQAVETECETALRLAMWEQHGIQPAAQVHLGQGVSALRHIGSYNCRAIRGSSTRMSKHATAAAIDIGGVVLADGTRIELLADWNGTPQEKSFLRDIRDACCEWFSTVLGPDYNALHADHFHLQNRGWGTCR
ncbi:extensin-like protein [Litoreibacter halocynthiae]|uniref:Extensin-like protein n=1 Tax=Litoreibacter halocynthiae TaxID=1242689 RepID=A0A4R7LDX0_9RHOB|nr:extensin family protein [Litoreibacter halocynthiae]TDT73788.1 extensin-like protein [Litoreibacter halocynthiae]